MITIDGSPPHPALSQALGGLPDAALARALADAEPGYDVTWWTGLLRSGVLSGGQPAQAAGQGTFTDLVGAVAAIAAAAAPSPVHTGVVQSGSALLEVGGEHERSAHLPALLTGDRRYAFCLTEADGGYGPAAVATRAARRGRDWVIDGVKCYVPYAASADTLLVVARGEAGHQMFAVDSGTPGIDLRPIPTIGADRQCRITLASVRVPDEARIGTAADAWPAVERALTRCVVALAADSLGAADAALRHAVAHVRLRHQWGTPLGGFQAVKHRCADMYMDVLLAREVVAHAAALIDQGSDARRAASTAKALCARRCRQVSAAAHQLCGGAGILADSPLHLWYRRIKAAEPMLGDPRYHRAVVADSVLNDQKGLPA